MTQDIQSINELKSYTEYNVSTPTSVFTIGFQYEYNVDKVNVYVDDVEATAAGYIVQHDSQGTVTLTPAVPSGVVRLSRETDIDTSAHTFSAGAKFTAGNMDENFEQIRHSQQEVRDGFSKLTTDTYEIIDTLQDVGQAAQDAANAAEQAAQTANDAAAQVNDKVSQSAIDYIHNNGAALPYNVSTAYEENAVVVKDGVLQQWVGGEWVKPSHNDLRDHDAAGAHPASAILDTSGETQQEINSNQKGINDYQLNLTEYSVENWALPLNIPIGDGVYRNVRELYSVGSEYQRFNSRTELESWLGFNLSTLINAIEETTIDTVIIQKAINELSQKYISSGEPSTLRFKIGGIYYVLGLNLKCGVNYIGQGAVFKKRPALSITNEGVLKWWKIAVADPLSFNTAEKCAHRCVIDGFTFDGNMSNMNWTYNTYNQEQGSSLLLQGAGGNGGGSVDVRGKFLVRNLNFINSVSDGLHIVQNSDVILGGGLTAKDCFRGGLVMTGGNSIVVGGGMVSNNARFDMEVDSGGYGGSFYTYRNIENYFQDIGGKSGDFGGGVDIESTSGSEVELLNFHVHSHPTNITTASTSSNKGKKLKIKSSTLTWGVGGGTLNRIMNPIGGDIFEDVKHRLDSNGYIYVLTVYNGYITSDDWAFNGGSFEYVGEPGSIANKLIAFGSQNASSSGFLVLKDLDTTKAPTPYLVSHQTGGKTEFNNVKHASTTAFLTKGSNNSYPSVVKFSKLNESSSPIEFVKVLYNPGVADGVIFTSDVKMPNSLNTQTNNNLGAATRSNRVVYGDNPPLNTTPSIVGDTYILNNKVVGKPYEWIATTTSVANSVYRAKSWIFGSFPTAELPVLTSFDAGCQNFDSTLGKVVTWTGTAWV